MSARQPARTARLHARAALFAALAASWLGACSHTPQAGGRSWYRPWHKAQPAGPEVAHELVRSDGHEPPPQTWDRATLRVDLAGLAGEGELVLKRVAGHDWPLRLALLVRAGSVQHIEVRGDQRLVLAVPADGGVAVLAVPPGLYSAATASLTVHYGP